MNQTDHRAVWMLVHRREKFTDAQADALERYYVRGQGTRTAARELGITREAFRKRLRGARRVVAILIQAEEEGRPLSTVRRAPASGRRQRKTGPDAPHGVREVPEPSWRRWRPGRPRPPEYCECGHRRSQHWVELDDYEGDMILDCLVEDCLCDVYRFARTEPVVEEGSR